MMTIGYPPNKQKQCVTFSEADQTNVKKKTVGLTSLFYTEFHTTYFKAKRAAPNWLRELRSICSTNKSECLRSVIAQKKLPLEPCHTSQPIYS
jgi:hypothetical protein